MASGRAQQDGAQAGLVARPQGHIELEVIAAQIGGVGDQQDSRKVRLTGPDRVQREERHVANRRV